MAAPLKSRVTDEEFRLVVAQSFSVAEVIAQLGLVPAGGNYKTVYTRIKRLELPITHFTGSGWNVGRRFRQFGKPFSWDKILVKNSTYTSTFRLRNRLILHGLKEHRCEQCKLAEWQGTLIPLELHHINGINNDHCLANLQLLCPNCHALTDTYRGKNQARAGVVE
ncbi:HNH endonuclease signature motif containing protein [Hymenobacter arizonensis]|uniref:HNH endonuclease n=1 Tax=Hymenobacter arizonensis TaxID=1227077 RepID=A0A1I5Y4Q1_HYMAR|nr:HNH endonuclease [Hymenobacter arizonensis]SFQ39185.1 hypothetical protein SAMN04515668_2225 [Hymenobacter arizonensis]